MKTYRVTRYLHSGLKVVWKHIQATSVDEARKVAGRPMVGGLVIVTKEDHR